MRQNPKSDESNQHYDAYPVAICRRGSKTDEDTLKDLLKSNKTLVKEKFKSPGCEHELYLLNFAVKNNRTNIVNILLDHGSDPNIVIPGLGKKTLLHFAAHGGYIEIVNALLNQGAQHDTKDAYGFPSLYYATSMGHREIVKTLLAQKPKAVLIHAMEHGENITDLLGTGAEFKPEHLNDAMIYAVAKGDHDALNALLAKGTEPCDFVLKLGCWRGDINIINTLLTYKTTPDYLGTALVGVAAKGHVAIVKALLNSDTDAKLTPKHLNDALTNAACKGHHEIVKVLNTYMQMEKPSS